MAQFQLGSISTGTLRPEDLAPVFIEELLIRGVDAGGVPEDMDELYEALNDVCPPFVYFGAREGDGADFGFWVDNVAVDDAITTASENKEGDAYITEDGLLAHDGHDATYMDMERNVVWSTV